MIKRHYQTDYIELELEDIEEFEERVPVKINTIKTKNSGLVLGGSINDALGAFADAVVAQQDNKIILRYITLLKEFGAANFEFVMRMDEEFSVTLDGDTFVLTGAPKANFVDTGKWETAFYSAVILRDEAAIDVLNEVDETVFFNANIKPDSFDLALVNLLQGLFSADSDLIALLEKAWKTSEPDEIDDDRFSYASKILVPLLPIIRCIFTPNAEDEFNEAMLEAVEQHKDFWTVTNEDNKQGWLSLPLMAVAVLAYDHKAYQLNFKTEYILDWLVTRDF